MCKKLEYAKPTRDDLSSQQEVAYVFWADPAKLVDSAAYVRVFELLNDIEQERLERLHFRVDQLAFAAAHGLLRKSLSFFADVAPRAWEFEIDKNYRPELAKRFASTQLRFNISHSRGLVACVVTKKIDCGIDVESADRGVDPLQLAKRSFHEKEYIYLQQYSGTELKRRFIELWTLKEAYSKARGLGLALDFSSFCHTVHRDLSVTFFPDTEEQDRADRWQFLLFHGIANHAVGVAIQSRKGVGFQVAQVVL